MGQVDIDLGTLPDSDVIPPGKYKVEINKVDGPEWSEKAKVNYLSFQYTVLSPEEVIVNGTPQKVKGRKVNDGFVPLMGRATFKRILRGSGYTEPNFSGSTDILVGRELEVMIGPRRDDPEQSQITSYLVPGEAMSAAPRR